MTGQNITPEGSAAPVYLDPAPPEPVSEPDHYADLAAQEAARAAGIAKLVDLGLTEEEALALVGG